MVILADAPSRPPDSSSSPAPSPEPEPTAPAVAHARRDAPAVRRDHVARNLSSFPALKSWGNKRLLGIVAVKSAAEAGPGDGGAGGRRGTDARIRRRAVDGDDVGLEEIREKLLVHLREAADRMNLVATPAFPVDVSPGSAAEEAVAYGGEDALPWKLRSRRPRMMRGDGGGGGDGEWRTRAAVPSPSPLFAAEKRSSRRRSEKWSAAAPERAKFSIALTREEIDEDIYAVTGARARRRPRKRPRVVQKQIDLLFPGFWLSEITAESYRVPE